MVRNSTEGFEGNANAECEPECDVKPGLWVILCPAGCSKWSLVGVPTVKNKHLQRLWLKLLFLQVLHMYVTVNIFCVI